MLSVNPQLDRFIKVDMLHVTVEKCKGHQLSSTTSEPTSVILWRLKQLRHFYGSESSQSKHINI